MEFIEVVMDDHKMLINIFEIVYIREQIDGTSTISLKGHNMSMTVTTPYEDIINQLNQVDDDINGGLYYTKAN